MIFTLLAAAIVERVAWAFSATWAPACGFLVAYLHSPRAWLRVRLWLDHGATRASASVAPVAGAVYWLARLYAPLARSWLLAAWSIGLALGMLLDRTLRGWASAWGPCLLAFLSAGAYHIAQEAVDFPRLQRGLAAFLSALMMLDQATAAEPLAPPRQRINMVIAAAVLLFFVNPLMGARRSLSLALLGRAGAAGRPCPALTMSVLLLAMFVRLPGRFATSAFSAKSQ